MHSLIIYYWIIENKFDSILFISLTIMNQLVNVNQFEKKILIKYKDEDLFSLMVTENH